MTILFNSEKAEKRKRYKHIWQVEHGRYWPYIWLWGYKVIPTWLPALAITLFRLWPFYLSLCFAPVREFFFTSTPFKIIIGLYIVAGFFLRDCFYDVTGHPIKDFCKRKLCVDGTHVWFYYPVKFGSVEGNHLELGKILSVNDDLTYTIVTAEGKTFRRGITEISIDTDPFRWYDCKFTLSDFFHISF